jgi:anti-sigma-K factor RskA
VEDIKAYIETGILELYVLGDISQAEKLQVEEMAEKYPEIKAELAEIERSLEAYALANEVQPPDHLRDKVLNSLVTNFATDTNFPTKGITHTEDETRYDNDNIVALPSAKVKSINFYKYAFAASMLALIASVFGLISLNNQLKESNEVIASLQTKNTSFANNVKYMENEITVLHDPEVKVLKLQALPKAPGAQLTVAWSPKKKRVMINLEDMKLAANDKAHQYQLWAIVDGKPVDLGVFDSNKADTTGMKEMKSVANAVMFAVTLEKHGGVPSPTMSEMVVAAKI